MEALITVDLTAAGKLLLVPGFMLA